MSKSVSNRGSLYYRLERRKHIERKKRIIKELGGYWTVHHDGVLSKGKIHCSCPLCRSKSYDYPKIQDIKTKQNLVDSVNDYFEEET